MEPPTKRKWVIMPVSVAGVGSGVIASSISFAFGFAHARIGNKQTDQSVSSFQDQVRELLRTHDVVVADRTNHLVAQRAALRQTRAYVTDAEPAKVLALEWDFSYMSLGAINALYASKARASRYSSDSLPGRFVKGLEPLRPEEYDVCVRLPLAEDLKHLLHRAVTGIALALSLEIPTAAVLDSSLTQALVIPRATVKTRDPGPRRSHRAKAAAESSNGLSRPSPPSASHSNTYLSTESSTAFDDSSEWPIDMAAGNGTELIARLMAASNSKDSPVTAVEFQLSPETTVYCWKLRKTAFYESPRTLPSAARSIWTCHSHGTYLIAARGYDKFFNIEEVPWLTWNFLEKRAVAPFHVMQKLNGCLILISAISESHLLVTSKQSLGSLPNREISHAQMGEMWLERQLVRVGRNSSQLAAELWSTNQTLLCELCDDEFEEHVIPVAPGMSGLHLHGINARTPSFRTEPPDAVASFARRWGFFETPFVTFTSISAVRTFVADCERTGSWNGFEAEGVVIRTTLPRGRVQSNPLPPTSTTPLFVKVKFEEPYMLFRAYREASRLVLSGQRNSSAAVPKLQVSTAMQFRPELSTYIIWFNAQLQSAPGRFEGILRGRGIISARKRFHDWLNTPDGQLLLATQQLRKSSSARLLTPKITISPLSRPWIIVFMGMPGCGKSAISIALSHLFAAPRVEADAINGRYDRTARNSLMLRVAQYLMRDEKIVIADMNAHVLDRRRRLRRVGTVVTENAKLLGIQWVTTGLTQRTAERICLHRLARRETNNLDLNDFERSVRHYVAEMRPLEVQAEDVDVVISVPYDSNLEDSIMDIITAVIKHIGVQRPPKLSFDDALQIAQIYRGPKKPRAGGLRGNDRLPTVVAQSYAFLPELDFLALFRSAIARGKDSADAVLKSWATHVNDSSGLSPFNHARIVLVQENIASISLGELGTLAGYCAQLPFTALFHLSFREFIANERIVVAVVAAIEPDDGDTLGETIVHAIPGSLALRLHIPVARLNPGVRPEEGYALMDAWCQGKRRVRSIALDSKVSTLASLRAFI